MSSEPSAKRARISTAAAAKIDVSALVVGIFSDDPSLQLESTIKLRNLINMNMTPNENLPNLVTRLVEFLKDEDSPQLQFEAAWTITNLSADKPKDVNDNGAVPILVELLSSPNYSMAEMAITALCNVSGGSIETRNHVLDCGVLSPLLHYLNEDTTLHMLRNATSTLSNLCRGKPPPPFNLVKPALSKLEPLLRKDDEQVSTDAAAVVWLMSHGSDEGMQSMIDTGFVPVLFQNLQHTFPSVRAKMYGTLCCILHKDKQQIQRVIDLGVLPLLANVLNQEFENNTKVFACCMVKFINEGTQEQINSVIEANLIPILVNLAQDAGIKIKRNCVWAITVAILGGSHYQVRYLVEQNCIIPLCDLLGCEEHCVILMCLDGLEAILKVGEAEKSEEDPVNYYRQGITDAGGHEKIKNLRRHRKEQIKEKAVEILQTYWRF